MYILLISITSKDVLQHNIIFRYRYITSMALLVVKPL